jgi:hypothetical protein
MTQEPHKNNGVSIFIAIIGIIGAIITLMTVIGNYNVEKLRRETDFTQIALTSISVSTQTPTQTLTLTPTSTYTSTPTPIVCPYQGKTDDETIVALIQAEAVAAQNKDMETLNKIFAAGAVLNDQANGKYGLSVEERYQETKVQDARHFDILLKERDVPGQTVYYTSGSEGYYFDTSSGKWIYYFNGSTVLATPAISPTSTKTQYGSEHWTLKKNDNGCWVIIQMDYNAGHVPFPASPTPFP